MSKANEILAVLLDGPAGNPPPLRFSAPDAESAHQEWGFNCGPAAVAAVLGLSIEGLRPHLGDFESKRFTNPTLMREILTSLGVRVLNYGIIPARELGCSVEWPHYGLVRVQWEGPWTKPGVPMRVRYRHTHWIGVSGRMVFDVNCMNVGGWVIFDEWRKRVVPWLLQQCEPHASGDWHVTHSITLDSKRVPT